MREDRRGGAAAAPTASPSSSSRCKFYSADRIGKQRDRPPPGSVDLWAEYERWKTENPEALERALSGGLIGSPETIRNRLHKYAGSHVDQIIMLNQAGKNTHEHICESLELFAKEVMPEFQAMEPEHQAWKQQVLAGEIELEEIDTSPYKYALQPELGPARHDPQGNAAD